jgi:uncharacterized membrane protein HdeD (DUF308 family)
MLAERWAVVLVAGVVTFLLGVTLAIWPRETAKVLAVLLAFQLIVSGVAQVGVALVSSGEKAARWLVGLSGVVALVFGALLLFSPRQTLTFIAWSVGACFIIMGAADVLDALLSGPARRRWWHVLRGALGVAFGVFLVANPDFSVALLALIVCVWLISYGFITVVAALVLRAEHRRGEGTTMQGGPSAPPAATAT